MMDTNKETQAEIQHHVLEFTTDDAAQKIEDNLWWLLGRKHIVQQLLKKAGSYKKITKIMDVGCGSGGVFDVLAEHGEVFGAEPSEILARRARRRGIATSVFEEDAAKLEITRQMDVLSMFDVLEHIEDDRGFLKGLRLAASEDHIVLLSVPAVQFLYGDHDRILHHHRRYYKQTLRQCFADSGYEVIYMSYFMFLLFPLVLLERGADKLMSLLGRKRTEVNIGDDMNPFIAKVLIKTLEFEAALSHYISFPIGLWLFALARPVSSENKSK